MKTRLIIRISFTCCTFAAIALGIFGKQNRKISEEEWFSSLLGKDENPEAKAFADSITAADSLRALEMAEALAAEEIKQGASYALADFNGDTKMDSAFAWKNNTAGDSSLFVRFTGCVPSIYITGQFTGISSIQSPGDIDEDGKAEVFIVPLGNNDCHVKASLWSLKSNRWVMVNSLTVYGCGENNRVEKHERNKYIVHYFESDSYTAEQRGEMTEVTVAAR